MMYNIRPVVLKGQHVHLEPLDHKHTNDLFEAAQDDDIWCYYSLPRPTAPAEITTFIENALANQAKEIDLPFAIIDKASGKAIGSTRYLDIQPANHALEIGFTWLGKAYWRTAINSEAKYLLLRHAFETLRASRVQLKTDSRNNISQKAIERIGGIKEGILRQHMIYYNGYVRDSVMYSILDKEWPSVKLNLETMLEKY